jgi:DivIVA domain-containing protein
MIVCLANSPRFTVILGAVANGEPRDRRRRVASPGSAEPGRGLSQPRRVPAEIRNVSFPVSARGYDRRSVDVYITQVNRLIAELEATRSPEAVLRRALEQAEELTNGLIDQARKTAEEITSAARREAEAVTARAKAEAADIVVNADAGADRAWAEADEHVAKAARQAEEILAGAQKEAAERLRRAEEQIAALREAAEARMGELRADTEAIWSERRVLLDDVRELAARLEEATGAAAARFPSEEPGESAAEGSVGDRTRSRA